MSRLAKTALILALAGTALSAVCLMNTTALTMSVFFFLGLPAFAGAIVCYLVNIFLAARAEGGR